MKLARLSLALGLVLAGLLALAACTTDLRSAPSQPAVPASPIASPCQSADPLQAVYADPDRGYCFVFPSQFQIGAVTTRTVSLQNPQVTETTPVLSARVEPAASGWSLAQIVDERLVRAKGRQPNLLVKRQAAQLNGHAAEEIVGLPGRPDAHWLFVLRDGDLVTLLFRPSRSATDAVRAAEQALWQQVMATFRFF